jgi:hypothetical protein
LERRGVRIGGKGGKTKVAKEKNQTKTTKEKNREKEEESDRMK